MVKLLPSFFSDGMVMEREAKIWGWAEPAEAVKVRFKDVEYFAIADEEGRFEITLRTEEFGGPYTLEIGHIKISDVYVGRVWLCGGQSNMELPINRVRSLLNEYIREDDRIRAFLTEKSYGFTSPARDVKGSWVAATGEQLDNVFAVPYFFARELADDFNDGAKIGLLNIAAGGTSAEAWLPEEVANTFPRCAENLRAWKVPGAVEKREQDDAVRVNAWHEELNKNDLGLAEKWYAPDYNDSNWETRSIPHIENLPPHGVVWFRKTVELPEITGGASLNLGRVVDSVRVYVNGEQVCEVGYQYPPCRCEIPEGVLKKGRNVIIMRAFGEGETLWFDTGKKYELIYNNKDGGKQNVNLSGEWAARVGCEMPKLTPAFWFYSCPSAVYNTILAPMLGYSVQGVIWYQGESNTGAPDDYKQLFAENIACLRRSFGENLPVLFVQLANFEDPSGVPPENWAVVREYQRQSMEIPNTGMAVIIDCGEWSDLHPRDKRTVGHRLALCARKLVYGEDVTCVGPTVEDWFADTEEDMLTIRFANAEGLRASERLTDDALELELVDAAGNRKKVVPTIKGTTLVVNTEGMDVKQVRFGWEGSPKTALYNSARLPASPFVVEMKA